MKPKIISQEKETTFCPQEEVSKPHFSKPKPEMFLFLEYKERKVRLFHEKQQKKRENNRVVYTFPGNRPHFPAYLQVRSSIAICCLTHSNLPFPQLTFFFQFQMRESLRQILFTETHSTQTQGTLLPTQYRCRQAVRPHLKLSHSPQHLQSSLLCREG